MDFNNKYINATMRFDDFTVDKIIKSGKRIIGTSLDILIDDEIVVKEDRKVDVILKLEIRDRDGDFRLSILMTGNFDIDVEYIEGLRPNLLAIMFPFMRSAVSYITSIDGKNPIILPPINFVEYSKDNKKETV